MKALSPGSLTPPSLVTPAARSYFEASIRNIALFHFLIDTVLVGDYAAHIVKQALETNTFDREIDPASLAQKDPGPRTKHLRKYSQDLLEAFLVRLADNFQVYLSDILRDVLRRTPAILRTRQQTVTLEYLLGFSSMDDLVQDIVETRVNSLSYKGFAELEGWCAERGIPLVVSSESRPAIIELIATRNAIVHNRAKVDEKYLRLVQGSTFTLGATRSLDVDNLFGALQLLNEIVAATDDAIAAKFGTERMKFSRGTEPIGIEPSPG